MPASRAGRPYTVADYLLDRLAECGVDRVFGVPGDFTLQFLDHVEAHPSIDWTPTTSELGAGYAADGYARIRGFGVVCTTFGVGELSTINAIAGAYAERVPVLSLVGAPTTKVQDAGRPTHHSLGDGDFGHTLRMASEVVVAAEMLTAAEACAQIDRVLVAMLDADLPGHLAFPADVAELPVDPPSAPLELPSRSSDPATLAGFTAAARALLDRAPRPVVLADILVQREEAEDALDDLLRRSGARFASLLWGRRVVDERHPDHIGIYVGAASDPAVRAEIEDAERLITVGVTFTDLTSGFFSHRLSDERRIDVLPRRAVVGERAFDGVRMRDALAALTDILAARDDGPTTLRARDVVERPAPATTPLGQAELWQAVAAALRPGDLVLADQGTSFYGIAAHDLPDDGVFLGQPLWASIGYTLSAALGAGLAARDRRTVLLIGDGAGQMTVAELSTIWRHRLPMLVVVVDNAGYTVERAIHGPDRAYNDIAAWDWTRLPAAFGAAPGSVRAVTVRTTAELLDALDDAAAHSARATLVQAVVPPLDVPPLLTALAQAAAAANRTPS